MKTTRSLLVLAAGTFTMVTAEMLPTAVLPQMSSDLGVGADRIGLLVSLWALTVVVLSVPLVRLTARWGRRDVVVVAMAALGLSAALTAAAATYPLALAARLLGAAACGLLWASVNALTADLVPRDRLPSAVAVVLAGATLGVAVGTPLAGIAATTLGWRTASGALAVVALAAAAGTRVLVRAAPAPRSGPGEAPGDDGELRPVVTTLGLTGLVLVGHFAAYTFVTGLLAVPSATTPGGVPTYLLVFGAASAGGLVLAGRVPVAHVPAALAGAAVATAVGLVLLPVADRPHVALAVVVLWGAAAGALPPLAQTDVMLAAGRRWRTTAGALVPVVLNGGIAAGAAAGSVVVARSGTDALPVPAALVVAAAAAAFAVAHRVRRTPAAPLAHRAG